MLYAVLIITFSKFLRIHNNSLSPNFVSMKTTKI